MGLKGQSADLGCVDVTLTAEGIGFVPATFASINRSVKEFSMTPATGVTGTNYTAILYLTDSELNAATLSSLWILKTDAATDAGINASNTVTVTPAIIKGENYTGFQGNFTGFSRFFLIDGPYLSVPNLVNNESIKVDNNPFHNRINISCNLTTNIRATIRLSDITGRTIFNNEITLLQSQHKFTLDCSSYNLAPGNYILQIIIPDNVFTYKMVKE